MDAAAQEETIDSLRVHVRRGLDRFLLGQYFTEYGLAEDQKLIPDDVDEDNLEAAGLTEKHSPFQLFLKAVASEIVKEKGETKGRKKRIREYLEVLQAFQEEWVHYIRKNMRKKVKQAVTPSSQMKQPATAADADKNKDGTDKKKKGGKRGPRGPYKKRKSKEEAPPAPAPEPEPAPKRQKVLDIDQLRKEFEEERDSIMTQVPEYNKKMFKQVGFAKWSKSYLPAMCLSPFAVPPGDIRDQWMKMFQNVKSKDRMHKMSHLVWWIGSKEEMGTYSVVARKQFLTYDEGQKKGMHEVPKKIKRLLEQGKKLSKAQEEEVEGLQQLNELALLAPDDREHPRGNFEEEDFWGYDEDELLQGDEMEEEEEELLDDEEDLVDSDVEQPEKKKKRKYKQPKQEGAIVKKEEDAEEVIYDDIVEVPPEPPKKKKKDDKTKLERGRKKAKVKIEEAEQQSGDGPSNMETEAPIDNDLKDTEEAQFPPASPPVGPVPAPAPVKTERLSLAEVLGDDDASASGDSALEDSDYGGDAADDDDDLGRETAPAKKVKKLKKKGSKNKEGQVSAEEKPQETSGGPPKKKKKDKTDKESKKPKKRTKAAEQRDLDKCVNEYLPLIEELKSAKERKDISAIQKKLDALLPVSDHFAASFFSEYEIPRLMKSTKTVLEEAGGGDYLSVYRKLWNRMKASYTEKAKDLPEGFKPKKRTPSIKSTEDDEPAPTPVKVESDALPQSSPSHDQNKVPVKIESDSGDVYNAKRISDADYQGTPVKIPIKQENNRSLSATSEQSAKAAEKAAAPQPKPKKFSVMDFMRKKKETPRDASSGSNGTDKMASSASRESLGKKTVPSWVTAPPPSTFDSFVGSERREDRLFALEFLLQAAAHFPAGKGVNEESVARGLEMAIYEWAESQGKSSSWSDIYWDKIHAVVAAITGKRDIGSLVAMIMDGHFSSPRAIVTLSDENLEHSFEGRPLFLNSE